VSAFQALQLATQAIFVLIAIVVTRDAMRQPRRTTSDIALLFGAVALLVGVGWVDEALGSTAGRLTNAFSSSLILSLPYLLVRLVADFTAVPERLPAPAAGGLAVAVIALFALPTPYPGVVALFFVLYFVGLITYVAVAFNRVAGRAGGVTRRRMRAVSTGCLTLGLFVFLVPIEALSRAAPWLASFWTLLAQLCALAAGLGFFLGFAPPGWLRRSWQEPEVRAFLGRAASLPRLPDTQTIIQALERGAANSLGVAEANIGLWDGDAGVLCYGSGDHRTETAPDQFVGGQAFVSQHPVFVVNAAHDDPANAAIYRQAKVRSVLAAPITVGETRLGVLVVSAPHEPIFANDDLDLVALLADQAAVLLESRMLIDQAARVRAREEATRLKDDFLSAAAHDLKTPLTGIVAQAQLLERRALRNPGAPADPAGVQRIVTEAQRLKRLVLDLLDVARVEQGKLVGQRERLDLAAVTREACARHTTDLHRYVFDAPDKLEGYYDGTRMMQLLDNLLENAAKYSPSGGEVQVRLRQDGASARLTITDPGIGIPASDLPYLFDRFHRGSNVDDRAFVGLGLGLFICRGIVEQHGGSIWATSAGANQGSTFQVAVPIGAPTPDTSRPEPPDDLAAQGMLDVAVKQAP
jgi:signal transduction histidine kinase